MARNVRDVMTMNPKTVRESDKLDHVAKLMKEVDSGVIPVCGDGNRILGLVTDRDIVVRAVAEGRNPADIEVSQVMSRELHTVRENDSLDRVMKMMSEHQVRRVPVVNDRDELVGIVAQADVATRANADKKVGDTVEKISERK